MRGVVFAEFLRFAEKSVSAGFVSDMIEDLKPGSGGVYDPTDEYDHAEILDMLAYIARKTGDDPTALTHAFGHFLFGSFVQQHPELLRDKTQALDFLEGIEGHIHANMNELIPPANPPSINTERRDKDELVMHYKSDRPFAELCRALIEASLDHFGVTGEIENRMTPGDGKEAIFVVRTDEG